MKQNKLIFSGMVLLSGILWGTIGLFTIPLSKWGLDSVSITAVRSLITAILLGIFLLIFDKSLFRIKIKDIWTFFGMGVISFSFFNICYFQSMRYNSLGTACILLYTAPIFVMLLSAVLFKERLTFTKLVCLGLSVMGCVLISGIGGTVSVLGLLFGIGSGFGYALYSIFSVYALHRNHFFTSIFYAFVLSALCLAPFCNWGKVVQTTMQIPTIGILLLGIAVVTTVLPYFLYTWGLKVVPAGEASVLACVEPLVANLVGLLAFNQTPTIFSVIGIVLILIAVVLLGLQKNKKDKAR